MPDFPRIGGASAAEVWGYGARAITDKAGFTISGTKTTLDDLADLGQSDILSDATPFAGGNISNLDAAISSRSSHAASAIWAEATRELSGDSGNIIRDAVLSDATKIPGANIDAAVTSRADAAEYTSARAAKIDKVQDFAEDATGTLSATGGEDTVKEITSGTTDVKLHCYIDLSNMTSGPDDSITVRQYMTIKAAGSPVKYAEEIYTGAQTLPMLHVITKPAKYGIKVTLEQTAGTNRDYDWQTFIEQAA